MKAINDAPRKELIGTMITELRFLSDLIRTWGTETVGGVEVLKKRAYIHPMEDNAREFLKMLNSYDQVASTKYKGIKKAWLIFKSELAGEAFINNQSLTTAFNDAIPLIPVSTIKSKKDDVVHTYIHVVLSVERSVGEVTASGVIDDEYDISYYLTAEDRNLISTIISNNQLDPNIHKLLDIPYLTTLKSRLDLLSNNSVDWSGTGLGRSEYLDDTPLDDLGKLIASVSLTLPNGLLQEYEITGIESSTRMEKIYTVDSYDDDDDEDYMIPHRSYKSHEIFITDTIHLRIPSTLPVQDIIASSVDLSEAYTKYKEYFSTRAKLQPSYREELLAQYGDSFIDLPDTLHILTPEAQDFRKHVHEYVLSVLAMYIDLDEAWAAPEEFTGIQAPDSSLLKDYYLTPKDELVKWDKQIKVSYLQDSSIPRQTRIGLLTKTLGTGYKKKEPGLLQKFLMVSFAIIAAILAPFTGGASLIIYAAIFIVTVSLVLMVEAALVASWGDYAGANFAMETNKQIAPLVKVANVVLIITGLYSIAKGLQAGTLTLSQASHTLLGNNIKITIKVIGFMGETYYKNEINSVKEDMAEYSGKIADQNYFIEAMQQNNTLLDMIREEPRQLAKLQSEYASRYDLPYEPTRPTLHIGNIQATTVKAINSAPITVV